MNKAGYTATLVVCGVGRANDKAGHWGMWALGGSSELKILKKGEKVKRGPTN